ncbi:MAG TPA: hypothetical protein VFN35_26120, partial [Ktedonobacteraceae bacterium]|nr:hypothetical protein [Ktedonobacteraceae bacterium]
FIHSVVFTGKLHEQRELTLATLDMNMAEIFEKKRRTGSFVCLQFITLSFIFQMEEGRKEISFPILNMRKRERSQ